MRRISFNVQALFYTTCFLFFQVAAYSQCAMCRAALETEGNNEKAEAVNDGIVYLMVIPYILVACIGYGIYKSRVSKKNP